MTWSPRVSAERREAIRRATCALVRLAVIPELDEPARRQHAIVGDVGAYSDREAWDAVCGLEDMLVKNGLVTAAQIEQARAAEVSPPVLRDGVLYLAWDRFVCASASCAGYTARYTGVTIGGAPVEPVTAEDAAVWEAEGLGPAICECGAVTQPAPRAAVPLVTP